MVEAFVGLLIAAALVVAAAAGAVQSEAPQYTAQPPRHIATHSPENPGAAVRSLALLIRLFARVDQQEPSARVIFIYTLY